VLRLAAPEWSAELVWSTGTLVDATADQMRGDEAVYAAFAIPATDLSATVDPPPAVPPQQHVTRPLPDLLAEAVRRTRAVSDPERSQPDEQPRVERDEDFLARLASTGLIRRTAVSTP
jgi:hypothetical protein